MGDNKTVVEAIVGASSARGPLQRTVDAAVDLLEEAAAVGVLAPIHRTAALSKHAPRELNKAADCAANLALRRGRPNDGAPQRLAD